jgi:hypothetical protein
MLGAHVQQHGQPEGFSSTAAHNTDVGCCCCCQHRALPTRAVVHVEQNAKCSVKPQPSCCPPSAVPARRNAAACQTNSKGFALHSVATGVWGILWGMWWFAAVSCQASSASAHTRLSQMKPLELQLAVPPPGGPQGPARSSPPEHSATGCRQHRQAAP